METGQSPQLIKHRHRHEVSPTRLIVASFVGVIVCGALLLMLPFATKDGHIGIVDAFFTATSATCVTGLVVFDTFTKFTVFGQVVIILLIQVGGLGLVTLTSFLNLAIGKRMGFKSMKLASESISVSEVSQSGQLLRFVMSVALIFEAVGAVLLAFVFVPQFGADGVFISVFIAISAFCNAGFDILGSLGAFGSLTPYFDNAYVLLIVSALIVSGGLGFIVWHDIANLRKTHHLRLHTKLVLTMTACLVVLGTIGIAILEWANPATLGEMSPFNKILNALFQSVSARTAGFNTIDLAQMSNVTKLFISVLMFIGAAPGGTGGGIKVTTLSVIIVAVASVVSGRTDATLRGHKIGQKTVYKSLAIFILSAVAVLVSALTIFYNSGPEINEMNSIFEAVSAFATVGLSVGVTSLMNPIAKTVTMLTMFIGRVGPVSLAITLSAKRDETSKFAIMPDARINVG
ncbi:MAG: potassium transporter TrkG [Oscillospiraceae bacterium]